MVWTEADFDRLSWHDNPVYGFFIDHDEIQWKSDLAVDVDHIVLSCGSAVLAIQSNLRSLRPRSHLMLPIDRGQQVALDP